VRAYELIHRKRDGGTLTAAELRDLVNGYTAGAIPDYQLAAFCMAVYFRGMDAAEALALTEAMLHSGDVLDLSALPGAKVDKHSTGGVGDKVSLPLAALAAACGVKVPMVSGRGLGHTGGTLDKLEAIPGFRVDLPVERFIELVRDVGAGLIGQTDRIAPADKKLYALRDVTATVESIPLIAASIMSKKLAEGIDGLVLDVKVGRGAFMKTLPEARALALALIAIGRGAGKRVTALLTAMDQPLGLAIGNALEVVESIELLRGGGPADLREVTVALTAEMLLLARLAPDLPAARQAVEAAIADGRGLAKWRQIVTAQGGDPRVIDDTGRLPQADIRRELPSRGGGFIVAIDAEALGLCAMALGAGRARVEDRIDPAVGLLLRKKVGDPVATGEPLLVIHRNAAGPDPTWLEPRLLTAFTIGPLPVAQPPLIIERLAEGQAP
jgi:pyrimidine-nucleoside phosphorylase/thymidine phosphorylase